MQPSKKMAFELKSGDVFFFPTGKRRCRVMRVFKHAKIDTITIQATVLVTGKMISKVVDPVTLLKVYNS